MLEGLYMYINFDNGNEIVFDVFYSFGSSQAVITQTIKHQYYLALEFK